MLNRQFSAGLASYTHATYSESQVRLDFIDKFWTALGWDVAHDKDTNPYQQEVKVERTHAFEGRRQHADYSFLASNYHDLLFFVEAKKPSVELDSPDFYFQVNRYGWPNAVPISVLTDYQRFRVIDCRFKPDIDTALSRAINDLSFDFLDFDDEAKFAKVYWLFSREAAMGGSIKAYAGELPKPGAGVRQNRLLPVDTVPFDEEFLSVIEGFRSALAGVVKTQNPDLTGPQLTEVIQRILDRLIFMRFLEDKLIEPEPMVRNLGFKSTSAWSDFLNQCKRLDRVYNGIIFKKHTIIESKSFQMDKNVFEDIRDTLSSDESPYSFEQIPIHILGNIYERFLGSIVVATAKDAKVVQKPEVRRAGGVYYTPEYIVREIVDLSVSKQVANRSPDELEFYRVCDLACGSGSFLLGLYDRMLRHYTAFYNRTENRRAAVRRGCIKREDGSFHLPLLMRREILLRHVYGVDIDAQAVEVAQLSLYLKLLEEETTASARENQLTLREALLPSLAENLKCGNSLVDWDDASSSLSKDDQRALNPMSFNEFGSVMRSGGFDAVIGNPPYDVLEKERGEASWPHDLLRQYVRSRRDYSGALGGKLNLFRFFIVRAISLVRLGGVVSLIVPLSLLADVSSSNTRHLLMTMTRRLRFKCFPQKDDPKRRVFKDAKLSTMIFAGEKRPPARTMDAVTIESYPGKSLTDSPKTASVRPADAALLDPTHLPMPLVDARDWEMCIRIHRMPNVSTLGQMDGIHVRRGEVNQTVLRDYISHDGSGARLLKGAEVARYFERDSVSQGVREWFDKTRFLKQNTVWHEASQRRIALQRITGIDERFRLVGTIISSPCFFADSTNSITIDEGCNYSLEYLLGLLNSRLFQWRFKVTSTNNNVGTNELETMPIRTINFSDTRERKLYTSMVVKVRELCELRGQGKEAVSESEAVYKSRRDSLLDLQIEEIVSALYGLTADESEYLEALVRTDTRSRTF